MFEKTDEGTVFFVYSNQKLCGFSATENIQLLCVKTETFNQGTEVEFG